MITKLNIWSVIAVAAVMLSAGVGYAGSMNDEEDATHYNATPLDAEDQTPLWKPISPDPNGPGNEECTLNEDRACKAIQTGPNTFEVVKRGDYPGL